LSSSAYAGIIEHNRTLKKLRYVEANNPFSALNTFYELKNEYHDCCIDIVPIGSKPMSLGVCLFAIYNSDVRVIYPFPEKYISETSSCFKKTWEYKVFLKQ
jgi:hypothetical protein